MQTIEPSIGTLMSALSDTLLADRSTFEAHHRHQGPLLLGGISWMLARVYLIELALEDHSGLAIAHISTSSLTDGRTGETHRSLGTFDDGLDTRWMLLLCEIGVAISADLILAGHQPSEWRVAVHPPA